jgi:hypothetical protein
MMLAMIVERFGNQRRGEQLGRVGRTLRRLVDGSVSEKSRRLESLDSADALGRNVGHQAGSAQDYADPSSSGPGIK